MTEKRGELRRKKSRKMCKVVKGKIEQMEAKDIWKKWGWRRWSTCNKVQMMNSKDDEERTKGDRKSRGRNRYT